MLGCIILVEMEMQLDTMPLRMEDQGKNNE